MKLSKEERKLIESAIAQAELNTSGEIRVHIADSCKDDVLDCATYWFEKLKMHQTALRNGVLFYIARNDRKFAILGDAGINAKVEANFWKSISEQMEADFKNGRFAEGLKTGILSAGQQLKNYFPIQIDDINELSNEVSFS
ncbi:MAG: TPM domain-containing protein [Bacteroidales bacterium]|nr:TPM domain-containing protein [Bacteroidales bacterium]